MSFDNKVNIELEDKRLLKDPPTGMYVIFKLQAVISLYINKQTGQFSGSLACKIFQAKNKGR